MIGRNASSISNRTQLPFRSTSCSLIRNVNHHSFNQSSSSSSRFYSSSSSSESSFNPRSIATGATALVITLTGLNYLYNSFSQSQHGSISCQAAQDVNDVSILSEPFQSLKLQVALTLRRMSSGSYLGETVRGIRSSRERQRRTDRQAFLPIVKVLNLSFQVLCSLGCCFGGRQR